MREVVEGSPAATAGVKQGDLLVRAGDHELHNPDDLFGALSTLGEGNQLVLGVVRGAEELTLTVTF